MRYIAPFLLLLCGAAHAGDCNVRVSPVNFGEYDPILQTAPLAATGNVQVECRAAGHADTLTGVHVEIALGPGSSGTWAARTLQAAGGSALRYNLYASPSDNRVWGDGQRGTMTVGGVVGGRGRPAVRDFPVHGRIPPGQDPAVGSYGDRIMVTVVF